jgi:hypothetical protein
MFGLFLVLETVSLHFLPLAGEHTGWVGALLLAAFFNIFALAVVAPLAGRLVHRRRPDLPRVVADDYAGTALLVITAAVLLTIGLVHRPEVIAQRDAFRAQSQAVRRYVAHRAPAEYRRNIERADSWQVDDDLYRTCIPGPDPRRALCLFVSTSQSPPGVRVDPNREPNSRLVGPAALGRSRR